MSQFDALKQPFELEVDLQRSRFADLGGRYDQTHSGRDEHGFAAAWLAGCCDFYGFGSLLEVGAGTGRFYHQLRQRCPSLQYTGIEPTRELREEGHAHGVPPAQLVDGNGYDLRFPDHSIDLLVEFAMLHHVKHPALVVGEMLRVARRAVFISDNNCFGHGSAVKRGVKQMLRASGLFRLASHINTRGKGHLEFGDGISYTYSVFDNLRQIRAACREVYILNTDPMLSGKSAFRSAGHVALLALKA